MKNTREELSQRFGSPEEIDRAVRRAVRLALIRHKRKKNSIAVYEEGQVRVLTSDDIDVPKTTD